MMSIHDSASEIFQNAFPLMWLLAKLQMEPPFRTVHYMKINYCTPQIRISLLSVEALLLLKFNAYVGHG